MNYLYYAEDRKLPAIFVELAQDTLELRISRGSGTRTHTSLGPRILSPSCLPITAYPHINPPDCVHQSELSYLFLYSVFQRDPAKIANTVTNLF